MTIPIEIITAVNALLAPYGESYHRESSGSGCLSMKAAAAHIGVSRSFLYELVRDGTIKAVKLTPGVKRGKVVIPISELDNYIAMRRAGA